MKANKDEDKDKDKDKDKDEIKMSEPLLSLSELDTLDRTALLARWQRAFGHAPPRHIRSDLMRRALGWHLQIQLHGGWDSALLRRLRRAAPPIRLAPGTRLIRVWQGISHQVTVLEQGYIYQGTTWRSLSAIARAITGTAWNGRVFFGISA